MKIAIVIPARFASSRFPGKPLAPIKGKPMISWVAEACVKTGFPVYIATDDTRIQDAIVNDPQLSIKLSDVILTKRDHPTGTDRCYEANERIGADLVVNVQGDEPLVSPQSILDVAEAAMENENCVINAVSSCSREEFFSPNAIKMVSDHDSRLLYASRSPLPGSKKPDSCPPALKQVCIYAIPRTKLARFAWCGMKGKTALERIEDVEILRFLELGMQVKLVHVENGSIAVDVPGDIAKVEAELDLRKRRSDY